MKARTRVWCYIIAGTLWAAWFGSQVVAYYFPGQ